jgi:hypothetical protein
MIKKTGIALAAFLTANGMVTERAPLPGYQDALALSRECAARSPFKDGAAPLRRQWSGNPESDYLSVKNGVPHIDAQVDLRYSPLLSRQERLEGVKVLERSRVAIEKFYALHGIDVSLTFHHGLESGDAAHWDSFVVYVRKDDATSRHTSMSWAINETMPDALREKIHIHEFGHLLGLPDEYIKFGITQEGEPDNIMNDATAPGAHLYPRQIRAILEPLCPGV